MSELILRVWKADSRPQDHRLSPGIVTIGRHESNTISLDDSRLSRHHALLTVAASGVCFLQDLGSRNGTFVGRRRISREPLVGDREFAVGHYRCRLLAADGPTPPAASEHTETEGATENTGHDDGGGGPFLGVSREAHDLRGLVRRVAATRLSVLITGPSGSGKGVVGRMLHDWSERAGGPFVVVNCAALPGELAEAELFGHRRGAFTGAVSDRDGRFQAARGGTLFLDEIGDMSLATQAKLLRAIDERRIEPVGSSVSETIDVRVIAATNRDLDRAIREGGFRDDLLFRLAMARIEVPPLRRRPRDVVVLAHQILAELIDEIPAARGSSYAEDALQALRSHSWPGNVRELRNVIAQALLTAGGEVIEARHLALSRPPDPPGRKAQGTLDEAVARHVAETLLAHGWNQTRAARALGVSRTTLRAHIAKFGLERPEPAG